MVFRSERTFRAKRYRYQNTASSRPKWPTHDEVVASRLLYHVRNQLCCDRRTTLVLFVLPCIREQWDDRGDSLRTGNLAGVDHYAEFHQGCIHCPASRVDDIHVVLTH
jgi:hypothetical protein